MQTNTLATRRTIASGFHGFTDNISPNYITLPSLTMKNPLSSSLAPHLQIVILVSSSHDCPPMNLSASFSVAVFLGALLVSSPLPAAENAPAIAAQAPAFNIETATRAYLDRLSPEKRARSNAYFEGGYWLQLWNFLYGAGIALLLLQSRLSVRMRQLACRVSRFKFQQSAIYGLFYILLVAALMFPLTFYSDFVREHQYGLATQAFGGWFGDWLKFLLVNAVLFCPLLAILMATARRLPRTWHIWGAVITTGFLVFAVLITPVFIEPLFNKYTALTDAKIVAPILRLARANGIAADKVYEVDASRQTTRISANVNGLLGTMRIALNDNLLKRCSPSEIEAVMAHEMGHYVLNHIYKMILFFGVLIVIGFSLLRWSANAILARKGARWGIEGIADVAVVPLFAFLFSAYLFLLTPLSNSFIRMQEVEADVFGLNAARQPDGFAEVSLKLADYRKLEPTPFEEFFFYDHPSGATRIRTAMRWKAESLTQ